MFFFFHHESRLVPDYQEAIIPEMTTPPESLLHEGILYYNKPEDSDTKCLGFKDNIVIADDSISYIGYNKDSTLVFSENGKFLSVGEYGKLVLSNEAHAGFSLVDDEDLKWTKSLSYNGNFKFHLFKDRSVGIPARLENSRLISINYEIDWPLPV